MELKDLFDCEFQQQLLDANNSMESLVMLANSMLTEQESATLLEISSRLEKELELVAGGVKFSVRHYMFPTVLACDDE